jgi:hypothetical protein
MKNITVSVTDLQHRRIHTWAAKRHCSASFLVRRFLEDLPKVARALQVINSYELDRMGIRPTPENQVLVDLLKPVARNKKQALFHPEKRNSRQQPEQNQSIPLTISETETAASACGPAPKNNATRQPILNSLPESSTLTRAWRFADRPRLPSSAADRGEDTPGDR